MPDIKPNLKLGDLAFSEFELPSKVGLGGAQSLVTHKLPGGVRVVQSMGRDDDDIQWEGLLIGPDAISRARQIDVLRIAGEQLGLSFFSFNYQVVIKGFRYSVETFARIRYQIDLMVVDAVNSSGPAAASSLDSVVKGDSTAAVALGKQVGDSPLSGLLSTMDSTIKGVSNFAQATQVTISSVLAPIAAVQQRVQTLIASTGNTINSVTTLGGILPNNPVAANANRLLGQVNATVQSPLLYNLLSVTGRMTTNLSLVSNGANKVTVGGGNLYALAAKQYGDATQWTAIAKANKQTDPQVSSIQTLALPDNPSSTGGVYPT